MSSQLKRIAYGFGEHMSEINVRTFYIREFRPLSRSKLRRTHFVWLPFHFIRMREIIVIIYYHRHYQCATYRYI